MDEWKCQIPGEVSPLKATGNARLLADMNETLLSNLGRQVASDAISREITL